MPVPDARVELQIGGVWTDAVVREGSKITHTRGRRDEGARVDAANVGLTLESPAGLYNNRNPMSPYYGLLGRNTPMRVSVDAVTPFLHLPGASGGRATTVDHANLDITGDIDVRIEAQLDTWIAEGTPIDLAGKWSTAPNFSWLLTLWSSGQVLLYWSTDGTVQNNIVSTAAITVPPSGRLAVRATLDVDNGAAGRTATFYTADSISGPWTQLGDPVTQAGTTSIFSGSAPLRVGSASNFIAPQGAVNTMELRNGIAGSVVANPNWTAQPAGTTSFVDGAGRTWTLEGGAEITSRRVRCAPEVSKWPPKWHTSGHNLTAPIQAAGILRRLGAGRRALQSTLRRRIPSEPSCVAYWPMEEESQATQAYSPIAGVPPLRTTGFDYASDDSLLGSSALPRLVGGASISMDARVPSHADTGNWMVSYVYWFEAAPATSTEILEISTTGTVRRLTVTLDPGGIVLRGYNAAGDEVINNAFAPALGFFGTWSRLEIIATTSGGNVSYHLGWIDVSGTGYGGPQVIAATAGIVSRINTRWGASGEGMRLGHLGVFNTNDTLIYDNADDGFQGETAAARFVRLTGEESVPAKVHGTDATVMGAQRPGQLLTLLEECEDSDGGILYEDRGRLALGYMTRVALYNQKPALTLDYGQLTQPFEPVEDDTVRNDVTVQRIGGSYARVTLDEGPLSVQDPPAGIGPYEEAVTLSLYHDGQPEQSAAWIMALRTWDEARYPRIRLLLHKYPALIPAAAAVDVGSIIRITNLPDFLPAGPLDLMVEGYEEELGEYSWEITFVCSPAGPWTVGVLEDTILGRPDTDGAILSTGVDATTTALEVHTDSAVGPRFIDSVGYASQFPFDVKFGGEWATATAIVNRTDAFTRSTPNSWGTSSSGHVWTEVGGVASDRSVNGTRGVITLVANPSTLRFQTITGAVGDAEVRVRMSVSAVATGQAFLPGVLLRYVDGANFYRARLHFGLAGAMAVSVTRDITQIGSAPALSYTYAAGDEFEVRVKLTGHTIQIRVWPVGQAEPVDWHYTETVITNTIASGSVGLTASAFSGNTNVSPQLRYDQFEIVTPQRFTLTRSINGISKSHSAGTAVSLVNPMRTAL